MEGGVTHLFTKCQKLNDIRNETKEYLELLDPNKEWKYDRDEVIDMIGITSDDAYYFISETKYLTWKQLMISIIQNKVFDKGKLRTSITRSLQFYIDNLAE